MGTFKIIGCSVFCCYALCAQLECLGVDQTLECLQNLQQIPHLFKSGQFFSAPQKPQVNVSMEKSPQVTAEEMQAAAEDPSAEECSMPANEYSEGFIAEAEPSWSMQENVTEAPAPTQNEPVIAEHTFQETQWEARTEELRTAELSSPAAHTEATVAVQNPPLNLSLDNACQETQWDASLTEVQNEQDVSVPVFQQRKPYSSYIDLSLGYNTGRTVECHQGYATAAFFCTPYRIARSVQPFLDARFHILNNGDKAFNVGVGGRCRSLGQIFGLNVFYDYLRMHKEFQQVGVGAEMLGPEFDFRINGYIPVGKNSKTQFKGTTFYPFGLWANHFHKEKQMGGVDGEVFTSYNKWAACPIDWDPYFAAGGYYFRGIRNRNYRGGKIRAGINCLDLFSLEVRASFDNINHTLVAGVFTISLPFTIGNSCGSCCDSCDACCWPLLCQPVMRNEIIATDKNCTWCTNF